MIESLLKKQIESSIQTIQNLNIIIDDTTSKIRAEKEIIQEATHILQGMCKHLQKRKVPGTYSPGGYDHVSQEHYTIECVNCEKVLESACIRGTYA